MTAQLEDKPALLLTLLLIVGSTVGCSNRSDQGSVTASSITVTSVASTTTTYPAPSPTPATSIEAQLAPVPATSTEVLPTTSVQVAQRATPLSLAQQLVTAFADADWETARRLSPQDPEWSDAKYAKGFAALDDARVYMAASAASTTFANVEDLWLVEVAHEAQSDGRQRTAVYCVHWTYDSWSLTFGRIAGRAVYTIDGFVDPGPLANDSIRGCAYFDDERSRPPTAVPPTASPPPAIPVYNPPEPQLPDISGWTQLRFEGADYLCRPASLLSSEYDCERYYGGAPPVFVTFIDLRCSKRIGAFDCSTEEYYPDELDGLTVRTVGLDTLLCQWINCWIWYSRTSPSRAIGGPPDYTCDYSTCTKQ